MLYSVYCVRHYSRTSRAFWTKGLVEVQNEVFGTHLRKILHDIAENLSIQVYLFAYTHNTQPFSHLHISPNEIVFHTQPRIPLNFQINVSRNSFRECTVQDGFDLPPHSHYQSIDKSPLFHSIMLQTVPTWFLVVETALLEVYTKVYQYAVKKINSLAHTMQNWLNLDELLSLKS